MTSDNRWIAIGVLIAAISGGLGVAGISRVEVKGKEAQSQRCYNLKPGDSFTYSVATSTKTTHDVIKAAKLPETVCLLTFK